MVSVRLPGIPWSGNVRKRTNVFKLNRHDDQWKLDAWRMATDTANRTGWTIPEHASVTVTFEFPDRKRRDPDNYTAALKGLLDGLVGVLIRDDSFEAIELLVRARQTPLHIVEGVWVQVEAL
jgi:Holliday junction resolvase RusA-like endonuclease